MARIRTIKPEFPQSESMGRVSRDARLAFVLLWTLADDAGRLRGNPRMLASLLFPYDDDAPHAIDAWLAELEAERCIVRYHVEGQNYVQIAHWSAHQKIDKPSGSKLPGCDDPAATPRESYPVDQGVDQGRDQGRDRGMDRGMDRGGEGEGDREATPEPDLAATPPDAAVPAHPLPEDYAPTLAHHRLAATLGVSLQAELPLFCDYYRASGKPLKDWHAAFNNWLRKARSFGENHANRHPASPAASRADTLARLTGQPRRAADACTAEAPAAWLG